MQEEKEKGVQQSSESQSTDRGRENNPDTRGDVNTGLRILIIDDMKTFLTIIGSGLKRLGQTVFVAQSGREGMQILETDPVDVVVCDLGMEEMDGWEVAQAVRDRCERKGVAKIPFVLLSGWGSEVDDQARLSRSGVDMALQKPVEITCLMQCLREVVGRSSVTDGEKP